MTLSLELAITVAQIVPLFFVIVVFDVVRLRRDVPRPQRFARAVAWIYRIAAYVIVFVLLQSLIFVAIGAQMEGFWAWVYVVLLGLGFLLLLGAVAARLEELVEHVAKAPKQTPDA